MSISPDGNFIGGWGGEIDEFDNDYINAAVWDSNRNLILLKDLSGNRFQGGVLDVSNHGYAAGTTRDGRGFIWHPSFDGVQSPFTGAQIFDDWFAAVAGGMALPLASQGIEAIAEDTTNGRLLFALSAYEAPGASAFVAVDVPELRASGFSNGVLSILTNDAQLEVRSAGGGVEVLRDGVLDTSLSGISAASVTTISVVGGAERSGTSST